MEETELLEALDRRARRAVDALDAALESAVPPPLPTSPERHRTWTPLLIAAALVLVALVGAGLVLLDGGDERSTVADDRLPVESGDGMTRLALADPGEHGYTIRAAFEANRAGGSMEPGPPMHWMAHVPEGSDPADAPIVVTTSLPADSPAVEGELVDIGVAGAVLRLLGHQAEVTWPVGDQARSLSSSHLTTEELLDVARAAVAAGWDGGAALPGHRLLHQGPISEFTSTMAYPSPDGSGQAGIAYDRPGAEDDLVIGWSTGPDPEARWLARRSMAGTTKRFEVRGRPASFHGVLSRSGGELSWLEPDGTLVQVAVHGNPEDVVDLLDTGLAPISAEDHGRLVEEHPPAVDLPLLDVPDAQWDPITEGPTLSELSAERDGVRTRVAIVEHEAHGLNLVLEVESADIGSGSASSLRDLRTPTFQFSWTGEAGGRFAIGGVVPPGTDLEALTITDRVNGVPLVPVAQSTAPIESSDHLLLVVVVEGGAPDARVDLAFDTPGGVRTWRL